MTKGTINPTIIDGYVSAIEQYSDEILGRVFELAERQFSFFPALPELLKFIDANKPKTVRVSSCSDGGCALCKGDLWIIDETTHRAKRCPNNRILEIPLSKAVARDESGDGGTITRYRLPPIKRLELPAAPTPEEEAEFQARVKKATEKMAIDEKRPRQPGHDARKIRERRELLKKQAREAEKL